MKRSSITRNIMLNVLSLISEVGTRKHDALAFQALKMPFKRLLSESASARHLMIRELAGLGGRYPLIVVT